MAQGFEGLIEPVRFQDQGVRPRLGQGIGLLAEGPVPQELRSPLREVVLAELPLLQRAVHPAPGWKP